MFLKLEHYKIWNLINLIIEFRILYLKINKLYSSLYNFHIFSALVNIFNNLKERGNNYIYIYFTCQLIIRTSFHMYSKLVVSHISILYSISWICMCISLLAWTVSLAIEKALIIGIEHWERCIFQRWLFLILVVWETFNCRRAFIRWLNVIFLHT